MVVWSCSEPSSGACLPLWHTKYQATKVLSAPPSSQTRLIISYAATADCHQLILVPISLNSRADIPGNQQDHTVSCVLHVPGPTHDKRLPSPRVHDWT